MTLLVHTVFERGLPQSCALKVGDSAPVVMPLYILGTGTSIYDIQARTYKIKRAIEGVTDKVVISRFKEHLDHFGLIKTSADVYDPFLARSQDTTKEAMLDGVNRLLSCELADWQRLVAGAAVVYHGLQERGILAGTMPKKPIWDMDVYSGRSKTCGYNIQGTTDNTEITNPNGSANDVFLHFDWAAADIRVAALLSGDELLEEVCRTGDPYEALSTDKFVGLDREECKKALLSSINSMATSNEVLVAFPRLRDWIRESSDTLHAGGLVKTLMGRKFGGIPEAEFSESNYRHKVLAAFNASMQGTIAHAMHATIAKIWERFPSYLLAEVHDSVVLTVPKKCVDRVASTVSQIMLRPFDGWIDSNPVFPVRISGGNSWKTWRKLKVVRGQNAGR